MKKLILFTSIIFLCTTIALISTKLLAQKSVNGLSVTPYSYDINVKPGDSLTKTFTVSNYTDQPVVIAADRRDFLASGEEGEIVLDRNENDQYSLIKWMSVSPAKITLASQQKTTFTLTVTVPQNAEPGGHFGSVVFGTVPDKNLSQSGAVVSQEIAALVLLRVPGHADEEAHALSMTPLQKFFEFGPVPFDIRVKNDGNVHVKATGTVTIDNGLGQKVTTDIPAKNILPGAVRRLDVQIPTKILIGKFTATAKIIYGTQNNAPLSITTTFYAFPVRIGIAVLIGLIILFLMRHRLYKAGKTLITGR